MTRIDRARWFLALMIAPMSQVLDLRKNFEMLDGLVEERAKWAAENGALRRENHVLRAQLSAYIGIPVDDIPRQNLH